MPDYDIPDDFITFSQETAVNLQNLFLDEAQRRGVRRRRDGTYEPMAQLILAGKNGLMRYFSTFERQVKENLTVRDWLSITHIVDMSALLKNIIENVLDDHEEVALGGRPGTEQYNAAVAALSGWVGDKLRERLGPGPTFQQLPARDELSAERASHAMAVASEMGRYDERNQQLAAGVLSGKKPKKHTTHRRSRRGRSRRGRV